MMAIKGLFMFLYEIFTDTQTVNFTLRSTLLNIGFGLVVDGVTFYDCSVRDKLVLKIFVNMYGRPVIDNIIITV